MGVAPIVLVERGIQRPDARTERVSQDTTMIMSDACKRADRSACLPLVCLLSAAGLPKSAVTQHTPDPLITSPFGQAATSRWNRPDVE